MLFAEFVLREDALEHPVDRPFLPESEALSKGRGAENEARAHGQQPNSSTLSSADHRELCLPHSGPFIRFENSTGLRESFGSSRRASLDQDGARGRAS